MDENSLKLITEAVIQTSGVAEKFRKIQENPALYGAENGLSAEEQRILEKLIEDCGPATFAATEIINRATAGWQRKG